MFTDFSTETNSPKLSSPLNSTILRNRLLKRTARAQTEPLNYEGQTKDTCKPTHEKSLTRNPSPNKTKPTNPSPNTPEPTNPTRLTPAIHHLKTLRNRLLAESLNDPDTQTTDACEARDISIPELSNLSKTNNLNEPSTPTVTPETNEPINQQTKKISGLPKPIFYFNHIIPDSEKTIPTKPKPLPTSTQRFVMKIVNKFNKNKTIPVEKTSKPNPVRRVPNVFSTPTTPTKSKFIEPVHTMPISRDENIFCRVKKSPSVANLANKGKKGRENFAKKNAYPNSLYASYGFTDLYRSLSDPSIDTPMKLPTGRSTKLCPSPKPKSPKLRFPLREATLASKANALTDRFLTLKIEAQANRKNREEKFNVITNEPLHVYG